MNMDGMRSALPAGPLLGLQADDDDEEIMAMDIPMMNSSIVDGGLGSRAAGMNLGENSHPRSSSAPRAVRRVLSALPIPPALRAFVCPPLPIAFAWPTV
jgi:hypothetical protein